MNHQRKTASSLANRMLLEKVGVSKRGSNYFIGKHCFFYDVLVVFDNAPFGGCVSLADAHQRALFSWLNS
jgi:hypothetical protein